LYLHSQHKLLCNSKLVWGFTKLSTKVITRLSRENTTKTYFITNINSAKDATVVLILIVCQNDTVLLLLIKYLFLVVDGLFETQASTKSGVKFTKVFAICTVRSGKVYTGKSGKDIQFGTANLFIAPFHISDKQKQ
jgi:hypothetical protein